MSKKGFTLFELLIVMLIMGVVYGLAINSMKKDSSKSDDLSLKNLNKFLLEYHDKNELKLICLEKCDEECYLFIDNKIQNIKIEPFLNDECEIFEIDQYFGAKKLQFAPYFDKENVEKDVCFEYGIDKYGGSKELIVECKDSDVVLLTNSLFQNERVFKSVDDVLEYKEMLLQKVNE